MDVNSIVNCQKIKSGGSRRRRNHRRTGSFLFRGAEVSCPNIFSIACQKIKWFCLNITGFIFFARKWLFEKFQGGPPAAASLHLWAQQAPPPKKKKKKKKKNRGCESCDDEDGNNDDDLRDCLSCLNIPDLSCLVSRHGQELLAVPAPWNLPINKSVDKNKTTKKELLNKWVNYWGNIDMHKINTKLDK